MFLSTTFASGWSGVEAVNTGSPAFCYVFHCTKSQTLCFDLPNDLEAEMDGP